MLGLINKKSETHIHYMFIYSGPHGIQESWGPRAHKQSNISYSALTLTVETVVKVAEGNICCRVPQIQALRSDVLQLLGVFLVQYSLVKWVNFPSIQLCSA